MNPSDQIGLALENEGYTKGTPKFERLMRARRVEACRAAHGCACSQCPAYDECELAKAHLSDNVEAYERRHGNG